MLTRLNKKLAGQPDAIITGVLFALALFLIIVALIGSPLLKIAVAGWVIAP